MLAISQPIIDGVFDGAAIWGNSISSADGQVGWADANAENIYVTHDSEYVYIGVSNIQVADWQSFGIIINTDDAVGSSQEVWNYPITYGQPALGDIQYYISGNVGGEHATFDANRYFSTQLFIQKLRWYCSRRCWRI